MHLKSNVALLSRRILAFLIFLSSLSNLAAQKEQRESPEIIVHCALVAMGTEQQIEKVENIQLVGYGYRNFVEQSERFEGPYIQSQLNFNLSIDFNDTVGMFEQHEKVYKFETKVRYLLDGDKIARQMGINTLPCPQGLLIMDDFQLNPLRLFQNALKSSSLKSLSDTIVQKTLHHRVAFLWKTFPVTITINADTHLPTMVEIKKPYTENYLQVWGDTKKVILYSFWDLLDNGVHYPLQKDIYFNGVLWESTLITDLKYNQPIPADSFRLSKETKEAIVNSKGAARRNLKAWIDKKKEIAPHVWLLPGPCNATIVEQDNALIIIESPNSSLNMELIFDEAASLFPNASIKQIITTSDAWFHVGGIRTAANKAPIIALSQNKVLIESLLKAAYVSEPDAWQKQVKKHTTVTYISQRTNIGQGTNRMELIPFRTEAGERMMMVYFPGHRLLYASDLLQPGNWQKHYSFEVTQAIAREKLIVDRIYAMHMEPISYAELIKQMEAYSSGK